MKRLIIALVLLIAPSAHAGPLDWTQGFTTDYASRLAGANDMWDAGTYTFDASATHNHALWETGGDATGDGTFMLVNGVDDGQNSLVWGKQLTNQSSFSLWAKNLCCVDKTGRMGPLLEFWFDGFKMSDIVTDGPGVWDFFTFIPPIFQGTHLFEVRNGSTVYDGNDFGLDAVGATPTPEPATVLLLGTGMLAAWRARRRIGTRA